MPDGPEAIGASGRFALDGASMPIEYALRCASTYTAMEAVRSQLLEDLIFAGWVGTDKKQNLRDRKLILDIESHKILDLIWKESEYVQLEPNSSRFKKVFPDSNISQYKLAVSLCTSPEEVSAAVTYVRNVVAAANSFDLVCINIVNATKSHVSGTLKLHNFMIRLASEYAQLIEKAVQDMGGRSVA